MSSNESYPQHVVTAVIVAHDGAPWLPQVADALLGQSRPVQRVVAVDTGSRDRSGAVLASKFGQQAVFGMERSTGYGAAIARALRHRAANAPLPGQGGGMGGGRVEWLWLLHDDCEPAPDALEQLLRGVAETSGAAVLGPKLRDWTNREFVLEAGITLDTAARRVTGIEPREVDQGQHDGDRDALAVSSAGMLVRRDVWEQVGGFDAGMGLFMEDIDFCWRVHSAGYRVRVITDAVAYHARAATRRKRQVSVGRTDRMLDRRNGLLTLLGNLPFRQMVASMAGNVAVSAMRITFFLLAKRLAAAMDETAALVAVLGHPVRLTSMRRYRASGRRSAYARVRADLPPGRSVRRLAEFLALVLMRSPETAGSHHASADPTEDESLLEDNGLARRLLTSPALLTFLALLAAALAAGRSLLGPGPLGGGSLIPAWGGASDLWRTYLQTFHPAGIGSTAAAPPWLAVVAGLSSLLAGKPWLAIDVILIGCVPLAGMTAMLAVRRVTNSAPVRVWASATYALLPVATGVVASGRFASAVAFVLLPLIVLHAGRVLTAPRQQASRSAWAAGLLVAVAAAFVPLLWLMAAIACAVAAIVLRTTRPGALRDLAVVTFTAPVLLMPWTLTLISHPVGLLLEAGLPQPGTPVAGLPASSLMLLNPGGPGLPPSWVTAGLFAAAVAALFARRRRRLITAGWGLALSGLLAAIVISHLTVRPADGSPVVVWAGLPLAIAALGLLLAAAAGADSRGATASARKGARTSLAGRGLRAAVIAVIAASAPLLAAVFWVSHGVSGPVHRVPGELVPELVAVADGRTHQVRTLVLRESAGSISYLLLRGPSPGLAEPELTPPADAQQALSRVVAELTTPGASLAVNVARRLADFDIGYVLVQAPVNQDLARELDGLTGLRPYSSTSGYALWQLSKPPARVSLLEANGTVVPIPSGQVGVPSVHLPATGGTLMLAEPAGGWSASVDGHSLDQVPSPAGSWAQAFRLPGGGGTLSLGHSGFGRDLVLLVELLAFLVVAALALPGIRIAGAEDQGVAPSEDDGHAARSGGRATAGQGRPGSLAAASSRSGARVEARVGGREPGGDGDDLNAGSDGSPGGLAARGAGLAGLAAGAGAAGLGAARALRAGRARGGAATRRAAVRGEAGLATGGRSRDAVTVPGRGGSGTEPSDPDRFDRDAMERSGRARSDRDRGPLDRDEYAGAGRGWGGPGREPLDADPLDTRQRERSGHARGGPGRDALDQGGRARGRPGRGPGDRGGPDRSGFGRDGSRRDELDRGVPGRDPLGRDELDRGVPGRDPLGRDELDRGATDRGTPVRGRQDGDRQGRRAAGAGGGRHGSARVRPWRRGAAHDADDDDQGATAPGGGPSGGQGRGMFADRRRRLPNAGPYAPDDTEPGPGRPADAGPYPSSGNRQQGRPGGGRRRPEVRGSRPYLSSEDPSADPSTGRPDRTRSRAWPHGRSGDAGPDVSGSRDQAGPPYPGGSGDPDAGRWYPAGGRADQADRFVSGLPASGQSSRDLPSRDLPASAVSGSSGRSPSGRTPPGAWPYPAASEPGSFRDGMSPSGRSPSGLPPSGLPPPGPPPPGPPPPGPPPAAGSASGSWPRSGDFASQPGPERDWVAASDPRDRGAEPQRRGQRPIPGHGGHGRDDRAAGQSGQRAAGPSAWPDSGEDALEPLPPLDSPRKTQGQRSRTPARDDSADRGRTPDRGRAAQRWSAPDPGYDPGHDREYDRGYEGDGW